MIQGKDTVFLTGGTGVLGSYLLKIILSKGHKVYLLVRSNTDKENCRVRVKESLNFWDKNVFEKNKSRLVLLEGDITKNNLGLKKTQVRLLGREVKSIFHCAAETKFNLPFRQVHKTNVMGTKNVLELASNIRKTGELKHVNHISTIYICGDYQGVFREEDLDVRQGFNTTYERSKFIAEKLIDVYRRKGLPVNVFRAPIVFGDSSTGKIPNHRNIYQLARLMKMDIIDEFPISEKLRLNFINVDVLAEILHQISSKVSLKNHNYHLISNNSISAIEVFKILKSELGFKKPNMIQWEDFDPLVKNTPTQKKLLELCFSFMPRNAVYHIDAESTRKELRRYGLNLPDFDMNSFRKLVKKHGYSST